MTTAPVAIATKVASAALPRTISTLSWPKWAAGSHAVLSSTATELVLVAATMALVESAPSNLGSVVQLAALPPGLATIVTAATITQLLRLGLQEVAAVDRTIRTMATVVVATVQHPGLLLLLRLLPVTHLTAMETTATIRLRLVLMVLLATVLLAMARLQLPLAHLRDLVHSSRPMALLVALLSRGYDLLQSVSSYHGSLRCLTFLTQSLGFRIASFTNSNI
jgi:hypothetical protein